MIYPTTAHKQCCSREVQEADQLIGEVFMTINLQYWQNILQMEIYIDKYITNNNSQ